MSDIAQGILINALTTLGLLALGWKLASRLGRDGVTLMIGLGAIGLLIYAGFIIDNIAMARYLPVSNLIIVGNISVPIVGFLVGVGARRMPGPWLRRAVFLLPLVGITVFKAYSPLLVQTPAAKDRWLLGVCLQTTDKTCSAAASATLLANHNIHASEQEMADLCLTGDNGTTMWGIYRGLSIKTRGTDWQLRPITGEVEALRDKVKDGPILLSVGLGRLENVDAAYAIIGGWIPGTMHTVVLYGFNSKGNAMIGDPKIGREQWSIDDLRILWHGQGLQMVRPQHPDTATASANDSPVLGR